MIVRVGYSMHNLYQQHKCSLLKTVNQSKQDDCCFRCVTSVFRWLVGNRKNFWQILSIWLHNIPESTKGLAFPSKFYSLQFVQVSVHKPCIFQCILSFMFNCAFFIFHVAKNIDKSYLPSQLKRANNLDTFFKLLVYFKHWYVIAVSKFGVCLYDFV